MTTNAKLIEAMALSLDAFMTERFDQHFRHDIPSALVQSCLTAANLAGYVMVERGLVEEVRRAIVGMDNMLADNSTSGERRYEALAARLRDALGSDSAAGGSK